MFFIEMSQISGSPAKTVKTQIKLFLKPCHSIDPLNVPRRFEIFGVLFLVGSGVNVSEYLG